MISPRSCLPIRGIPVATALGAFLLVGCAQIHTPPVPLLSRLGLAGSDDASCGASIGRAHSALAQIAAAGSDPAATATAHAAHAAAMGEYHSCLARQNTP